MTNKGNEFLKRWIETSKDPDILDYLDTQALKNGAFDLAFLAKERKERFKGGTGH